MGNSNKSCNQCSCQSSPSSTRRSSKSYTDCCTETTCITIETTGNVGPGTAVPEYNICVTDSCNTDSCNTVSGPSGPQGEQSRSAQRLANRRSRRGR